MAAKAFVYTGIFNIQKVANYIQEDIPPALIIGDFTDANTLQRKSLETLECSEILLFDNTTSDGHKWCNHSIPGLPFNEIFRLYSPTNFADASPIAQALIYHAPGVFEGYTTPQKTTISGYPAQRVTPIPLCMRYLNSNSKHYNGALLSAKVIKMTMNGVVYHKGELSYYGGIKNIEYENMTTREFNDTFKIDEGNPIYYYFESLQVFNTARNWKNIQWECKNYLSGYLNWSIDSGGIITDNCAAPFTMDAKVSSCDYINLKFETLSEHLKLRDIIDSQGNIVYEFPQGNNGKASIYTCQNESQINSIDQLVSKIITDDDTWTVRIDEDPYCGFNYSVENHEVKGSILTISDLGGINVLFQNDGAPVKGYIGKEVTIKANFDIGANYPSDAERRAFRFYGWKINGEIVSRDAEYTFTVPEAAELNVVALITNTYEGRCEVDPQGAGSVFNWNPATATESRTFRVRYDRSYESNLYFKGSQTEEQAQNYTFIGWRNEADPLGSYPASSYPLSYATFRTFYINSYNKDFALTALFRVVKCDITFNTNLPAGTDETNFISLTGTHECQEGEEQTVSVLSVPEYHEFVGWSVDYNGEGYYTIASTDEDYVFTVPNALSHTITAVFKNGQSIISLTSDPEGVCEFAGGGVYESGTTATVSFTQSAEQSNYGFLGWYNADDELLSNQLLYSFVADGDLSIKAKFALKYYVTISADPQEAATVPPSGDYAKVDLSYSQTESQTKNFRFRNWCKDDANLPVNQKTILIESPCSLKAVFESARHKLFITADETTVGSGIVIIMNGDEEVSDVEDGGSVTIKAVPNEGSVFLCWSDGNKQSQRTLSDIRFDYYLKAIFVSEEDW